MKELIKSILLYAGNSQADYERAYARIYSNNTTMVSVASAIATSLTTVMYFLSLMVDGVARNRTVYGIGALISLSVFITSILFAKKVKGLTVFLVYVSYVTYYTYGVLIGVYTDPGQKTVTFMVLLVFLQMLFICKPIGMATVTSVFVIAFIRLSYLTKTGDVLDNDVIDAIIFGLLGLMSGWAVNRVKIKGYAAISALEEVSRSDQLTKMNNRNAYELDLYSILDQCRKTLGVVYIDVNGLKTINDKKGHKAGDKMLACVAEQILKYFAEDFAYRVGGDEFIVFIPDASKKIMDECLGSMVSDIESHGYHVAIGYEIGKVNGRPSLDRLLKEAETKMYKDKSLYYKTSGADRRRH